MAIARALSKAHDDQEKIHNEHLHEEEELEEEIREELDEWCKENKKAKKEEAHLDHEAHVLAYYRECLENVLHGMQEHGHSHEPPQPHTKHDPTHELGQFTHKLQMDNSHSMKEHPSIHEHGHESFSGRVPHEPGGFANHIEHSHPTKEHSR